MHSEEYLTDLLSKSRAIDDALDKCAAILKCSRNEVLKRVTKMTTQLNQCKEIIDAIKT